jgi:predicted aspartyl protease
MAVALLAAAACTFPARAPGPAEASPGEVRFELAGLGEAALLVPVRINGQGPYRFVLDTGATLTCLDQSLAGQLSLPERRGMRGVGAGVRQAGAVSLVSVETVEVGTARAEDLTACVLDLSALRTVAEDARGLLGLNFLKPYRVTIDFERSIVALESP